VVPIDQMWELGSRWFGGVLDADWTPRPLIESQALLARLGLTGRFWELA
jgi:hypothetical protein